MVTRFGFGAPTNYFRVRGRGVLSGTRQGMMAAQLRQRLLRPAALADRGGRGRRTLDFLLTKLARRKPKSMAERPAEMRGIIKTVAKGNFRDRMVRLGRVRQFRRGP